MADDWYDIGESTYKNEVVNDFLYASADDVFAYLRIDDPSTDEVSLVEKYLRWVRDEIDDMIGTTFGLRYSGEEVHTLGNPWVYAYWVIGAPFFTKHYPIRKILSLQVWNGGQYEEWVGKYEEGRLGRYWVEWETGKVYVNSWLWHAGGMEVKIKYIYGYGDVIDNGDGTYSVNPNVPWYAKRYSVLYASRLFISSEFMIQRVAEGGAEDLKDLLQNIDEEMEYLRSVLQSYKINAGGFIS